MEQPENKLKWLFLCGLLAWVGTYTKEGSRTCRLVGIMLREREREREVLCFSHCRICHLVPIVYGPYTLAYIFPFCIHTHTHFFAHPKRIKRLGS